MNYNQFISKHLGKAMDYDGAAGVQCVDLIKFYLDEVFGIKPGKWGNAKDYYEDFTTHVELTSNFTRIANSASFIPKKGDIVVWGADVSSSHNFGHIAIAKGVGDTSSFYSYDQNWNGKECHEVKHSYKAFLGVLRPKDQSKITGSSGGSTTTPTESFPTAKTWNNGSTTETVYKLSNLTTKIGSLSPRESAKCYRKIGNGYLLVYNLNGTTKHKAGFVKYAGGVSSAPTSYKTYRNGSTSETIYADTAKKTKVGSLNPKETCKCLGKIDGMYLLCYKVDGTTNYKCGFAVYSGGCK